MTTRIPTHPGAVLREDVLPELRMSAPKAADALGISRQMFNRILNEKAPVTPAMALRIGAWLGNGPDLWINMQVKRDLALAARQLTEELPKIPRVKAA